MYTTIICIENKQQLGDNLSVTDDDRLLSKHVVQH
jgi:hypothetical protein